MLFKTPTFADAIGGCARILASHTFTTRFYPPLHRAPVSRFRTFKMATKSAADMLPLSLLYKTQKLAAPEPNAEVPRTVSYSLATPPAPSKSFNDRISLCCVDITLLELDAIVNAANKSLLGGGGVDGAIHRAAGRDLWVECSKLGGCQTGSAKITDAHKLPCNKVIHAVGPIYDPYEPHVSEKHLTSCYTTSLELAVANGCRTVAFSAISTGIYGYPSTDAAPVAITAVRKFLESDKGAEIDLVVFVVFERKDVDAYTKALPLYFPPVPPGSDLIIPANSSKDKAIPNDRDTSTADADIEAAATETATAAKSGAATPAIDGDIETGVTEKTQAIPEDIEAEKIAKVLPEVPRTDPAENLDTEHINKKAKRDD